MERWGDTVLGQVEKKKCFLPLLHFLGAASIFLLVFIISNTCTNKNQKALLLLCIQFSSTECKENYKYKRDGFCLHFNSNTG